MPAQTVKARTGKSILLKAEEAQCPMKYPDKSKVSNEHL